MADMIIGVDIDDVLADFMTALIEYHNAQYNTTLLYSDFYSYNYCEVWGCTLDKAIEKVGLFYKTQYFKSIQPIPGSIETLTKLKRNNTLYAITSRFDSIQNETHVWLTTYFPGIFTEVFFTDLFKGDFPKRKSDFCREIHADIMIEDSPDYSLDCAESDIPVLLVDRPWNQETRHKNITRVYSWDEILNNITIQTG